MTIEQLAASKGIDLLEDTTLKSIRLINRLFRDRDESHLYPIDGNFNLTERAIRWYRRVYFPNNGNCLNLEYIRGLNEYMSRIVNGY